eukprot:751523-Hanusia_phi.AAC.4
MGVGWNYQGWGLPWYPVDFHSAVIVTGWGGRVSMKRKVGSLRPLVRVRKRPRGTSPGEKQGWGNTEGSRQGVVWQIDRVINYKNDGKFGGSVVTMKG